MNRLVHTAVKAAALGGALLCLVGASPKIGQSAPDFQLSLVNGSKVSLHELRGDVVVLNFWATWCQPCKKELPLLDAFYKINHDHGLRVFAVTTEDSLSLRQLKPLFAAMTVEPVKGVHGPYHVLDGVPTNFVIDRAGNVRYAKAGAFTLDEINAVLVPLLAEKPPTPMPAAS